MVNNQQNRLESSESVPENILYELKYGSNFVSQNFNFNYLLPEFVGMKINDEKMVGSATGEDAIRFICALISDPLSYAMGSSSVCTRMTGYSAETEWENFLRSDNYVYLRFICDIPDYLLRAFYCNDYINNVSAGDIGSARELILVFDDNGDEQYAVRMMTKNDGGDYFIYQPATGNTQEKLFNIYMLSNQYRNTAFTEFKFAIDDDSDASLRLSTSAVVCVADHAVRNISLTKPVFTLDNSMYDELLRSLSFNPDNLNTYRENDDTDIFLESHGTLRVSSNSVIYRRTGEDGPTVSGFLNAGIYEKDNIYQTVNSLCIAANKLATILGADLFGDAQLKISSINYSDKVLSVDFALVYSGIPLTNDGNIIPVIRFDVRDNEIIYLHLNSYCVKPSLTVAGHLPQTWYLNLLSDKIKDENSDNYKTFNEGYMRLIYDIDNFGKEYSPSWSFVSYKSNIN